MPQAATDAISGGNRGGFDSYGYKDARKIDPGNPLHHVLGNPQIGDTSKARKTFGNALGRV